MLTAPAYFHHDVPVSPLAASRPLYTTQHIEDLRKRAEETASDLTDEQVVMFEYGRANLRKKNGLPPVPVTDRGQAIMNARRIQIDKFGFLEI